MVRGDGRGRVVARSVCLGDVERLQAGARRRARTRRGRRRPRTTRPRGDRGRGWGSTRAGGARRSARRVATRAASANASRPTRTRRDAPRGCPVGPTPTTTSATGAIEASGVATTTTSASRPTSSTSSRAARRGRTRRRASTGRRRRGRPPRRPAIPPTGARPRRRGRRGPAPRPRTPGAPRTAARRDAAGSWVRARFLSFRPLRVRTTTGAREAPRIRRPAAPPANRPDGTSTRPGATSASGARTNPRSHMRGCGTTRSGSSTSTSPTSSTSTSSVRGPQRSWRTRCASVSSRWASPSSAAAVLGVSSATTALRYSGCSGPPTGSVEYTEETATTVTLGSAARLFTARWSAPARSPRFAPRPR